MFRRILSLGLLAVCASFAQATTYVPIINDGITIIIPIDDPPVAVNDSFTLEEKHVNLTFPLALVMNNDVDENLSSVVLEILSQPSQPGLSVTAAVDNTVNFTVTAGFVGTTSFTYQLTDENDQVSEPATVSLQFTEGNDPPVANDDGAILNPLKMAACRAAADQFERVNGRRAFNGETGALPDCVFTFNLTQNDLDQESPTSSLVLGKAGAVSATANVNGSTFYLSQRASGWVRVLNNNSVQWFPDNAFIVSSSRITTYDWFDYEVRDPQGLSSVAELVISSGKVPATKPEPRNRDLIVELTPQCNEDLSGNLASRVAAGCEFEVDVLSFVNDPDSDVNQLSITSLTDASGATTPVTENGKTYYVMDRGHARIDGKTVYYVPASSFYSTMLVRSSGSVIDSLGFTVQDQNNQTASASIDVKSGYYSTTIPAVPGNLQVTRLSSTNNRLTWDPVPGAIRYRISIKYEYRDWTERDEIDFRSSGNSKTWYELPAGTRYYKVRACNAKNQCSEYSEVSEGVMSGTTIPLTPTNLVAEKLSNTENRLTWADVPGIQEYRIHIKFNEAEFVHHTDQDRRHQYYTNTNQITWDGLDPGNRQYKVQACSSTADTSCSPLSAASNVIGANFWSETEVFAGQSIILNWNEPAATRCSTSDGRFTTTQTQGSTTMTLVDIGSVTFSCISGTAQVGLAPSVTVKRLPAPTGLRKE